MSGNSIRLTGLTVTSVNPISTTDISVYLISVSDSHVYILALSFPTKFTHVIKVKVTHDIPRQALRGDGGIALTHSQPGNRRRLKVSTKLRPLYTQRNFQYPSHRRVGEIRDRSGREEKFHPLLGIRPPHRSVRSESVQIVRNP
jgi:hypothetical protein